MLVRACRPHCWRRPSLVFIGSTKFWQRKLSGGGAADVLSALAYSKLKFNSVEIDIHSVESKKSDLDDFEARLAKTLDDVRAEGCNAAFLTVPMTESALIAPAGRLGFRFHHAEKDMAKLYLWLADVENKIPDYGTHSVGVGGVVLLRGTTKMLVIKEHPPFDSNWKLPGGYANLGEDFCEASMREVYEETNVTCEFKSILGFRHSHKQQFGRSNLYVICLLEAASNAADSVVVDAEIQDARWMELEEYRRGTKHPMSQLIVDLVLERRRHETMTDLAAHRLDDQHLKSSNAMIRDDVLGLKEKVLSHPLSGPAPYKFYHI